MVAVKGVLPSPESDSPAADIALGPVSALGSRLPHSPGCDRLVGGGDRERCCRVLGEGTRWGSRLETGKTSPSLTDPHPLTFGLCFLGVEGPGKATVSCPGAHLIPAHLRTAPAGRGRGELGSAPRGSGLGYCIVPVWARSRVFYLPRYPRPRPKCLLSGS